MRHSLQNRLHIPTCGCAFITCTCLHNRLFENNFHFYCAPIVFYIESKYRNVPGFFSFFRLFMTEIRFMLAPPRTSHLRFIISAHFIRNMQLEEVGSVFLFLWRFCFGSGKHETFLSSSVRRFGDFSPSGPALRICVLFVNISCGAVSQGRVYFLPSKTHSFPSSVSNFFPKFIRRNRK